MDPTKITAAPSSDLVDRTRDERSILKLIELAVPGFRGYRKKEDIRQADALVRDALARRVAAARKHLEAHRSALATSGTTAELAAVASVLSLARALELEIRHAEQGYSEARSALAVGDAELLALYSHDESLLAAAGAIETAARSLVPRGTAAGWPELAALEAQLRALRDVVEKRRRAMLGLM